MVIFPARRLFNERADSDAAREHPHRSTWRSADGCRGLLFTSASDVGMSAIKLHGTPSCVLTQRIRCARCNRREVAMCDELRTRGLADGIGYGRQSEIHDAAWIGCDVAARAVHEV